MTKEQAKGIERTNAEQADLAQQGSAGNLGYIIFAEQVIEPLFDCKTIYEMCSEIAKRHAVENRFTAGTTQPDWPPDTA